MTLYTPASSRLASVTFNLPLLNATSLDSGSASATFGIEIPRRLHLYSTGRGFAFAVRLMIRDFPSSTSNTFFLSALASASINLGLSIRK